MRILRKSPSDLTVTASGCPRIPSHTITRGDGGYWWCAECEVSWGADGTQPQNYNDEDVVLLGGRWMVARYVRSDK